MSAARPAAEENAMADLTLESLAKRIEALENALAEKIPKRNGKDWRKVVGMFHDSEFMRMVDDECQRMRELERAEARSAEDGMILIDTDHATFLKYPESDRGRRFINRLERLPKSELVAVAIVTVEERMRGWLAVIAKEKTALRQVAGYRELAKLFDFYQEFEIVPFDEPAARRFDELRAQRLRLGTMDLKIAAITLVNGALLLSANQRDFERVQGLRVENWIS
jgi:tRNA(fMet)-specific endonuclease VapC